MRYSLEIYRLYFDNTWGAAAPQGSTVETGDGFLFRAPQGVKHTACGRPDKENQWKLLVFLQCYDYTMTP